MIAHFDLDAFFVSVEILLNPALKGLPLAVGGHSDRGVVAACSYEARRYGVHSAMPMRKAKQLCPVLTVVPATRGAYSQYSRIVSEMIAEKAPLFEKASIDEFYIDLSGMDRYFNPLDWTIGLRQQIIDTTRLPISFGMSSSKMIAKIATDAAKPNGYLFVEPGTEQAFLDPMPVNKIPGVGRQSYQQLLQIGIETIRELRLSNPDLLGRYLGNWGRDLWQKVNGLHRGTVSAYHETKSVSTENTFHEDIADPAYLLAEITRMSEKIGYELRKDNKMAGCIAVKIRYADFETTSRQSSVPYTFYDDEILLFARQLFGQLYRKGQFVRLIGVKASELTNEALQTNLFSDQGKKAGLYKAIDAVKDRFGKSAINTAGGRRER